MPRRSSLLTALGLMLALTASCGRAAAQAKPEILIARQSSIVAFPGLIMEKQHLIEKHAARLGLPNLKVTWTTPSGSGSQTGAVLAGTVDISNTSLGSLLLLWDRTKGGVLGIVAMSALPEILISRTPSINSLQDFGPADKIAMPTIRVSTQALLLQMACAKLFGFDHWDKLDANTVQLGYPDATAALANPQHEVSSHFSGPPFQFYELKNVPGAHAVMTSTEIVEGPLTQSTFFTSTRFAEANPVVIEAVKAATMEAQQFIHDDTRAAVEIYSEIAGDKTSADEILDMLKQPEMMDFNPQPQGVMKLADHMYRTGILKSKPAEWTDIYLPIAHDLPGN